MNVWKTAALCDHLDIDQGEHIKQMITITSDFYLIIIVADNIKQLIKRVLQ